jgi:hypothetical protein
VGVIRFDFWYGPDTAPGSSEWYAAHNLDAPQYQYRAPWFAKQVSPALMSINGQQADMDAEIVYAANAGVKYWAFGFYQTGRPAHNAWAYYQASPNKALVNWCVILGLSAVIASYIPVADLVGYFGQANHEKFGARPLLYVMADSSSASAGAAAVTAIRTACSTAGVGNPYIVLQSANPATGAVLMAAIGADALGAYGGAPAVVSGPQAYTVLDTAVRATWATQTATGVPVVPCGMTGWDRRPRIERPTPFDLTSRPYGSMSNYFIPGTPAQIAAHVTALVAFVTANTAACPANKALLYSWNEFDEGGGGLCPTWTTTGPDNSRLAALAAVLQ